MKKRSSLKTNRCELFTLVISKITTPVQSPWQSKQASKSSSSKRASATMANQSINHNNGEAYDDERSDGLIDPAILLEEVAEDDAGAEQRDEQVDGHHRRVVGGRVQSPQPRRRHLQPHASPPATSPATPPQRKIKRARFPPQDAEL